MGKWIEFRKTQIAEKNNKSVSACHLSVTSNTDSYDIRDTGDVEDFLPSVSVVSAFENIGNRNKETEENEIIKSPIESVISSNIKENIPSNSQNENEVEVNNLSFDFSRKNNIQFDDAESIYRVSTNSSAKEHLQHLLKIGWSENSSPVRELKKKYNL